MKMCKDTVLELVKNDIIAKNVEVSEKYYWVFEQVNSEIDLMVLDDDTLLYVTKIICDNDDYEIHTKDTILHYFDADELVLKANGTGQIVSWNLYAENNIDFVNYSKVL